MKVPKFYFVQTLKCRSAPIWALKLQTPIGQNLNIDQDLQ